MLHTFTTYFKVSRMSRVYWRRLSGVCLISVMAGLLAAAPSRTSATRLRQSPKPDSAQLSGAWRVSLHETDGVEIDFRITFAVNGMEPLRWEAYSRQGAAREMVGGGAALLGRILGKMPPHEALIYIGNGTGEKDGDAVSLKGTLESPFLGRRDLTGTLTSQGIHADLARSPSGVKAGTFDAVRDSSEKALRDYTALGAELERAVRENIFDPALLQRRDARHFFEEISSRFAKARDDLDVIGSFQALKPLLGTSHLEFIRNPRLASRSADEVISGDEGVNPDTFVRSYFAAPEVAFLRVTKWDRVAPAIDRAFERINSAGARVLILDIRGNPGGDATSMAPLAHLIREPVTVGAFFGRKWYEAHAAAPTPPDFADLRAVSSDAPPAQMLNDLRQYGAVTGKALPRPPYFAGSVYLLVDHSTASASEPLAYTMHAMHSATVVGERTAGAMLMALPHGLRDGWVVTIPEADFIAADGVRLEAKGVEPDVKAATTDVFLAVADQIEATLPYSAAVLRGGTYEALKRPADAESAYRAALRLAERQRPVPGPTWLASVHKRLAIILKAKGNQEETLREYREVLKLVPDDADALAAVRAQN
jgi:tetratricopeptide (TPR) repeat protein